MRLKSIAGLCLLLLPLELLAQENPLAGDPPSTIVPASSPVQPGAPDSTAQPAAPGIETGKRIFGVLPNYKTVDKMTAYEPLSTRAKFMIATKDSFDWPVFFAAGATSGLNQLTGQNEEWGEGVKGFSQRYTASLADLVISNYLTEAILPSMLHHDPRYFRLGQGSAMHRIAHALSWVIISKTDSNHNTLNVSELLGSGASAAIGMLYYPVQERNGSAVADRFITQVSFDAASSVLKEYWPDIRQWLTRKHH
jgi:hypothetical protein